MKYIKNYIHNLILLIIYIAEVLCLVAPLALTFMIGSAWMILLYIISLPLIPILFDISVEKF